MSIVVYGARHEPFPNSNYIISIERHTTWAMRSIRSLSRDFVEAAEAGIVNKNKIKMEQNETKTRRSHPRVKSFDQCDLALCWQLPLEFLTAAMVKFAQKDAQITERTSFVSYFVRIFYYSILRRRLIPVHDDMIRCCLYMFRIGER